MSRGWTMKGLLTWFPRYKASLWSSKTISSLIHAFEPPIDFDKEIVLWHGTSNNNVEKLLQSTPQLNNGAFGHGFYLATMIGKSDQYTSRDDEAAYTTIIAYRCIPTTIIANPHLSREAQFRAETEQLTSFITKDRGGRDLRYCEVIMRDASKMQACLTFKYDLYNERVGLPSST